jgi:uncharacterized protein YkwD
MKDVKLLVFYNQALLCEFEIEEDKRYTIGSDKRANIPILDEAFPLNFLTFKRIREFISIEHKDKNVKIPPSLKLPFSFSYGNYKFMFSKSSPKLISPNLASLKSKNEKKKIVFTTLLVSLPVVALLSYFIIHFINTKKLEREFNNDFNTLATLKPEEILARSQELKNKYKNTKFEIFVEKKMDELLKLKNEYLGVIEKLKLLVTYRSSYMDMAKLLRKRKKILEQIKWETYQKEAAKLLNKLEQKIIFIKHRSYLQTLHDIQEQIKDERFAQAFGYINNILPKNKTISNRNKKVLIKKLEIAYNKDKEKFYRRLLALIKNEKFEEAKNLVYIKRNTYPVEAKAELEKLYKEVEEAQKQYIELQEEKKNQEKKVKIQSPDEQVEKKPTPQEKKPLQPPQQKIKEEVKVIDDKELIKIIKDKNFTELQTIFSKENYQFKISPQTYDLAKTFQTLPDKLKERKAITYTAGNDKKTIQQKDDKIILLETKRKKEVKLEELDWKDLFYIALITKDNYEDKINILSFAKEFGLETEIPQFLGFLYETEKSKQKEIQQLVAQYLPHLKNKNPIWKNNQWVSEDEIICSELQSIVKKSEIYTKILPYLEEVIKKDNLSNLRDCEHLKFFLSYIISLLKKQYDTTLDKLFLMVDNELEEIKKEMKKVIRSKEYLQSVLKRGEQVEWDVNSGTLNEYQQFLNEKNQYLDKVIASPWESEQLKAKFKDEINKLMIIYTFFDKVDREKILQEFLKKWDEYWKPKWEKIITQRYGGYKNIEEANKKIFENLKKNKLIKDEEIECIELVNKYRVKLGLNALTFNIKLYNGAKIHAIYLDRLAKRQIENKQRVSLSHFQQGTDTRLPEERAKKAGYNPTIIVENIGYTDSADKNKPNWIMAGWQYSPTHHKGLITEGVLEIGCYKENFAWVLLMGSEK